MLKKLAVELIKQVNTDSCVDKNNETKQKNSRGNMSNISYDCLIIGAGISGINAAYYLQKHCPWATYRILEKRSNLGGTWDLFKYPGIRSDSDMFTFGFSWKVWSSPGAIASGAEILAYLKEAAVENDILKHVDFDTDVKSAEWRSADNQWHLVTTEGKMYMCNFLIGCTGYYSYDNPHLPYISGQENFKGLMVHPQMWQPEHSKEMVGKKVAIIGSGATAITLLPSISECVDHVTMVQRTPAYIAVRPREDPLLKIFRKIFPFDLATKLTRWITSVLIVLALKLCVHFPNISKRFVKWTMYRHLSGSMSLKEFEKHFNPPYTPYQQRLCLAPQGDFFKSIKSGKASIATGHIDHLTERGIRMKDGSQVEADFIIMATGLTMSHNFPFSTMQTTIDGQQYKPNQHLIYKGCMLESIPNMAFIMGYAGVSWTLKADIVSSYITSLLNFMNNNQVIRVTPREDKNATGERIPSYKGSAAGYVQRAEAHMPLVGNKGPWVKMNNYLFDLFHLCIKPFTPESLELVKKADQGKQS